MQPDPLTKGTYKHFRDIFIHSLNTLFIFVRAHLQSVSQIVICVLIYFGIPPLECKFHECLISYFIPSLDYSRC